VNPRAAVYIGWAILALAVILGPPLIATYRKRRRAAGDPGAPDATAGRP